MTADVHTAPSELAHWRHHIHAHPELGFAELQTSDFIAEKLLAFGVDELHRGIGGTGLVAVVRGKPGDRAIGLRADMDALPIHEDSDEAHTSQTPGVMHACGHDGHTVMLLGAARELCATRNFAGTVYLVFQPAEEALGMAVPGSTHRDAGALAMMRDGLFTRFPMEAIFGIHNRPGIAAGKFGIKPGVIYAAADRFEIRIVGKGCHAARPHLGIDPIMVSGQVIGALQTISSRFFSPAEPVVVSVCEIMGGSAFNIIADDVKMVGTVRALSEPARQQAEALVRQITQGVAASFGAHAEINYQVGFPALINDAGLAEKARAVMVGLVGEENVVDLEEPTMGGEDFACYLTEKPGCFVLVGNGIEGRHGLSVHNARYDFNDAVLPLGVRYWRALAEALLPA